MRIIGGGDGSRSTQSYLHAVSLWLLQQGRGQSSRRLGVGLSRHTTRSPSMPGTCSHAAFQTVRTFRCETLQCLVLARDTSRLEIKQSVPMGILADRRQDSHIWNLRHTGGVGVTCRRHKLRASSSSSGPLGLLRREHCFVAHGLSATPSLDSVSGIVETQAILHAIRALRLGMHWCSDVQCSTSGLLPWFPRWLRQHEDGATH